MDTNSSCYLYSNQYVNINDRILYIQQCDSEAAELGEECCKYQCIMANSLSPQSAQDLCSDMTDSYISCMRKLSYYDADSGHFSGNSTYFNYAEIGRASSIATIACCLIVIFIAVFLKFYNQWAEQIILSKTMFVLGFGLSLLSSFDRYCTDGLAAVTSSLIVGDLLWTIVLLWVLKNTANRPFQQTSFAKGILLYWAVVVAICFIYGFSFRQFLKHFQVSGHLQYVPICRAGCAAPAL